MRKIRMKVEELDVESFEATLEPAPDRGTAHAHALSDGPTQCVRLCVPESSLPRCNADTDAASCAMCTNSCGQTSCWSDCAYPTATCLNPV